MGRHLNARQRTINTKEIQRFITCVFADEQQVNLEEFIKFNTSVSSEMFLSVMSVLEERLPCSEFYYRELENFKNTLINKELVIKSKKSPLKTSLKLTIEPEEELVVSSVKAIASPRMMTCFMPQRMNTLS